MPHFVEMRNTSHEEVLKVLYHLCAEKLWKARGDDFVPSGGKEELQSRKWSPKRCFYRSSQILIRLSGGTQEEIIIPPRFMNLCTVCSKDQPRTLYSINNIVERFWRGLYSSHLYFRSSQITLQRCYETGKYMLSFDI